MEVTRDNFKDLYPIIENEIKNCEYLSIDCEFSGIENSYFGFFDEPEERFLKRMRNEMKYDIVQFGLSIFNREENELVKCSSYNFYIFKYHVKNSILKDHKLNVSASAFEFLSINGFDFNKLFKKGITYCTISEEQRLKASFENKDEELMMNVKTNFNIQRITHDALVNYNEFLNDTEQFTVDLGPYEKLHELHLVKDTLKIAEKNRRNSPDTNLGLKSNGLKIDFEIHKEKNTDFWRLRIVKLDQNLDKFKFNSDEIAAESVGFSKLIQAIIHYGKPIVGHNVFVDIMHIINQFISALPENYDDFKYITRSLFPIIIDTKVMSTFLDILSKSKGNICVFRLNFSDR